MKGRIAEASEDVRFLEFCKSLENSANYFIAINGATQDQAHAIDVCIAEAYLEGKKNK